jgi:hypothetical protein
MRGKNPKNIRPINRNHAIEYRYSDIVGDVEATDTNNGSLDQRPSEPSNTQHIVTIHPSPPLWSEGKNVTKTHH